MKKNIIPIIITLFLSIWACTPENPSQDFNPIPDAGRIIIVDMADDNAFMFVNGLRGQVLPPRWDFGNGQTAVGDSVFTGFAFAGNYDIKMTYFDGNATVTVSRTLRITHDNMELVSDPVFEMLTGGISAANGKTWVLDSLRTGHVHLRRPGAAGFEDRKAPMFYAGTGMYDDELTFILRGARAIYDNKGQSYSHGGAIDGIPEFRINQLREVGTVTGVRPSPAGDFIVNYTPGTNPQGWSLTQREFNGQDTYFLTLTGGAYMFFYRGSRPQAIEYRIDSISENYMRVANVETYPQSRADAGWETRFILVPKGYPIQPEVPVTPDPPRVETINEGFEGASHSITFTVADAGQNPWGLPTHSVVRNVSMLIPNPSDSIMRVVRGTGSDERLVLSRDYTFDLTTRNKLNMQVLLPTTNNYVGVNLQPTVEVRLVDSQNAALTATVTHTVAAADFGRWINLTFDFSGSAAITSFNRWEIQFGGRYVRPALASPGIFYFDNIHLTE
jgi:hypothetical protein